MGEAGAVLKSGTEADGKSKKGSFGANKNSGQFFRVKKVGI